MPGRSGLSASRRLREWIKVGRLARRVRSTCERSMRTYMTKWQNRHTPLDGLEYRRFERFREPRMHCSCLLLLTLQCLEVIAIAASRTCRGPERTWSRADNVRTDCGQTGQETKYTSAHIGTSVSCCAELSQAIPLATPMSPSSRPSRTHSARSSTYAYCPHVQGV